MAPGAAFLPAKSSQSSFFLHFSRLPQTIKGQASTTLERNRRRRCGCSVDRERSAQNPFRDSPGRSRLTTVPLRHLVLALLGLLGVQTASGGETEVFKRVASEESPLAADPETTLPSVIQRLRLAEARIAELESSETDPDRRRFDPPDTATTSTERAASVFYDTNGFGFATDDGAFALAIQNRIQARYANPFDSDPRTPNDLDRDENSFMIRRARTKFQGHAYQPWLEYYLQYDWADPILRDMNLTISRFRWATLEIGRSKVLYNDERKTSSANQQFVNRSIVNDIFTVDRQQGIQLYGNLLPGAKLDTTYYVGVFTGQGVGERTNDDNHLMYNARLQWNATGGEIPFSQSDIDFQEQPMLNFAVAANTNRSSCLAFETSQDSCRPLPWAPYDTIGEPGQYRINQMMGEIRFKWVGFSLLHEIHVKEINDTLALPDDPFKKTAMLGGFIQAGYFAHYDLPPIPKNLEIAGRYAFVDPRLAENNVTQQEVSGVMTYFLNGHRNKVNFQVSHLTLNPDGANGRSGQRAWLQWDLTY